MTDQPGFIPSEDRGARLLEQIREQLYLGNVIALAEYRAPDIETRQVIANRIEAALDRTAP